MHKQTAEADRLGHNIAASAAQLNIESCCFHDPPNQDHWYNIERRLEGDERADVAMAARYLELRGLLKRDPANSARVRLVDKLRVATAELNLDLPLIRAEKDSRSRDGDRDHEPESI